MSNNEGGRASLTTQDAGDILDRSEPARRRLALGPKPPFVGGGADASAAIAAAAEELYNAATELESLDKGPSNASPGLIRAYNHAIEALETPAVELQDDVAATFQMGASALARAAAGRRGREELRVLAGGLTQRLRRLGYNSQDPAVGILADENPSTTALKAIKAAQVRVDDLARTIGGVPAIARAGLVAETSTTVATLMREGAVGSASELVKPAQSLADSVQALVGRCRTLGVELESSRLDLILRGADDVLEAAGEDRKGFLANYYGKRTITGMTGSHAPGSEELGETHVQDILDWLKNGAVTAELYADISAIVKEPLVKKEPTFFEAALTEAIIAALSLGPGLVMKALVGKALAPRPGAQLPAAKPAQPEVTAGDIWGLQEGGDLPGPATPGPNLSGGENAGLRNIGAVAAPLVSTPITSTITARIRTGVAASLAAKHKTPLATAFIEQVREGAVADMASRFEEAHELKRSLAMIPPAQVQEMFGEMKARATAEASARRAELVMKWADFVVKATSGLDAANTVDQLGGDLNTIGTLPGTVQIPVTVTMSPNKTFEGGLRPKDKPSEPATFRWGAVHMNGMSASALAELRAANIPLGTAKLHRVYELTVLDNGNMLQGRIDVNPEGVVDATGVDQNLLAKIGMANPGVWNPAPNIVGTSAPNAQEGVRQILAMGNLTTAEIK